MPISRNSSRLAPGIRAAAVAALLSLAALSASAPAARAQRLLVQKNGALVSSGLDGADPRPLFPLGGSGECIGWAASSDGRRIAWMVRASSDTGAAAPAAPGTGSDTAAPEPAPSPTPAPALDLAAHPVTVYLSDVTGVHQKRLFSTDSLRDRRGKKVTVVGAEDLPGDPDDRSSVRQLSQWEPLSLSWSADGRTLYVSCRLISDGVPARAALAVDAASGAALVDADGRWKSVAPVNEVDARGVLLVGAGAAEYAPPAGAAMVHYSPLMLLNLAQGARTTLFSPAAPGAAVPTGQQVTAPGTTTTLPDYAFAQEPALSGNDNRFIVFTSANKGLWLLDRTQSAYRQLLDRNARHPRWTPSATGLYFLEPRPAAAAPGAKPLYDLYGAAFSPRTGELAVPQLVQQGVEWFDIVPE